MSGESINIRPSSQADGILFQLSACERDGTYDTPCIMTWCYHSGTLRLPDCMIHCVVVTRVRVDIIITHITGSTRVVKLFYRDPIAFSGFIFLSRSAAASDPLRLCRGRVFQQLSLTFKLYLLFIFFFFSQG